MTDIVYAAKRFKSNDLRTIHYSGYAIDCCIADLLGLQSGSLVADVGIDCRYGRLCYESLLSRKWTKRRLSDSGSEVSHSQTTQMSQPSACKSVTLVASRALFLRIFSRQ